LKSFILNSLNFFLTKIYSVIQEKVTKNFTAIRSWTLTSAITYLRYKWLIIIHTVHASIPINPLWCIFPILRNENHERRNIATAHNINPIIFQKLKLSHRRETHTNNKTKDDMRRILTSANDTFKYFRATSIHNGIQKSVIQIISQCFRISALRLFAHCKNMFTQKIGT
jgi:hypothetical protein